MQLKVKQVVTEIKVYSNVCFREDTVRLELVDWKISVLCAREGERRGTIYRYGTKVLGDRSGHVTTSNTPYN